MRSTLLIGLAVIFFISVSLVSAQENGTKPPAPPPTVTPERPEPGTAPRSQFDGRNQLGAAVQVQTGLGELEMASSNDGRHVVIAANSGYSFSDDFGETYTFGG